jgi:hypothetical protein
VDGSPRQPRRRPALAGGPRRVRRLNDASAPDEAGRAGGGSHRVGDRDTRDRRCMHVAPRRWGNRRPRLCVRADRRMDGPHRQRRHQPALRDLCDD